MEFLRRRRQGQRGHPAQLQQEGGYLRRHAAGLDGGGAGTQNPSNPLSISLDPFKSDPKKTLNPDIKGSSEVQKPAVQSQERRPGRPCAQVGGEERNAAEKAVSGTGRREWCCWWWCADMIFIVVGIIVLVI